MGLKVRWIENPSESEVALVPLNLGVGSLNATLRLTSAE